MIRISLNKSRVNRDVVRIMRRFRTTQLALKVFPLNVWEKVNRYLELEVREAFFENRSKLRLKKASINWKQSQVDRGVLQPRTAAGTRTEPPLQNLVPQYGRLTDFFQQRIEAHYALGEKGQFVREVKETSVAGGLLNWGIDLSKFYRGYPAFILKPPTKPDVLSISGNRAALVSVDETNLAYVLSLMRQGWFRTAMRAGFVR